MSNYIVLVKQVPDITQITGNAFDPETGTLIRNRLASVINELDAQALAFANRMRDLRSDEAGRIVCLTMGPPMAQEVLRYCLSRCADTGILLTDRALGGADTWATANPLAFAIRKIVADIFAANEDYYIICGMQSVDGDTAQVPAQIAEELAVPCIAYATDVEYTQDRFIFRRIISGGSEMVASRQIPCVITVAKYEYPLFATFTRTRWARRQQIIQWSADDINAKNIGIAGSKTRVLRVFPPGTSTRKCQEIADVETLARVIIDGFDEDEGRKTNGKAKTDEYVLPKNRADKLDRSYEGIAKEVEDFGILCDELKANNINDVTQIDEAVARRIIRAIKGRFHKKTLEDMLSGLSVVETSYSGDVWVVAEHNGRTIHQATFELIGKARQLASCLQVKTGVVLPGDGIEHMARELIAYGADNVYLVEDKILSSFDVGPFRKVVADAIDKFRPQIVLFAATPWGRVLAPMVSYRLGCGLTADCTALQIRDSSRRGQIGILMQTRPALGGNVMAMICTKDSWSQMATVRPGVMKKPEPDYTRAGVIARHAVKPSPNDTTVEIIKRDSVADSVNLTDAEIVVSGGVGMQSRDNYEQLLNSLCEVIGEKLGTRVERGASRAAVERGFADRVHQVGQTGTSIGPKIYLALGISGAIQHMIGIANSRMIIAVNNDPHAPIFKQCDYYIVASVEEVVPQLVEMIKHRAGKMHSLSSGSSRPRQENG